MSFSDGWKVPPQRRLEYSSKIAYDNLFRWWVSVFSLLTGFVLWGGDYIKSIGPIVATFLAYNLIQGFSWLLIKKGWASERVDFILHAIDNVAITASVYFTGGARSAFFFLYSIPVVVETYHRNLRGLIFNAALGLCLYAGFLISTLFDPNIRVMVDVSSRLIFLALFSVVCAVSVRVLRKRESSLERHLQQQKMASAIHDFMDTLSGRESFELLAQELSRVVTQTAVRPFWYARVWLRQEEDIQTLLPYGDNPGALQDIRSLSVTTCPALRNHSLFHLERASEGAACPLESFSYGSHLCLPIMTKKNTFGVLFVGSPQEEAFSPDDLMFLGSLVKTVAFGLERLVEVEELHYSHEVGARALATFLSSTRGVNDTISAILEAVIGILDVDRCNVMLWDPKTQVLRIRWFRGTPPPAHSLALKMGEGMAGTALENGLPCWASDVKSDAHFVPSPSRIRSLLCVPMQTSKDEPLGVINALTMERVRGFSKRDVDFLVLFSRQAALAIENAMLHEEGSRRINQLQELDKMKSDFLSSVSHELRGPLTAIEGFGEVLSSGVNGRLNPKQLELLEQISLAARTQMRMVQDLLDLSAIERGFWKIEKAPCSVARILNEEFNKARLFANGQGIEMTLYLPSKEPAMIDADAERIRQVVWNLLHNAVKYTRSGDRVELSMKQDPEGLRVMVADTGAGIPPDSLERIFLKFHQAHGQLSQRVGGLGLGLALAKEIVEAHGGWIKAESQGLGHGSLFTFCLPFSPDPFPSDSSARV